MDPGPSKRRKVQDPILHAIAQAKFDRVAFVRLLADSASCTFEEKLVRFDQHHEINIGRSSQPRHNNSLFDCAQLSAHHATMKYNSGSFTISDNNSRNGTYVNGEKVGATPVDIFCGDKVKFGTRGYNKDMVLRQPIICLINVFDENGNTIYRPNIAPKMPVHEDTEQIVEIVEDTESLVMVGGEATQDPAQLFEQLEKEPDDAVRERLAQAKRIYESGVALGGKIHFVPMPEPDEDEDEDEDENKDKDKESSDNNKF